MLSVEQLVDIISGCDQSFDWRIQFACLNAIASKSYAWRAIFFNFLHNLVQREKKTKKSYLESSSIMFYDVSSL